MFRGLLLLVIGYQAVKAETTVHYELYGSSSYSSIYHSSVINPDNLFLELPTLSHALELRPDIRWQMTKYHTLIIRSRHIFQNTEIDYNGVQTGRQTSVGYSDLSDAYMAAQLTNELSLTAGLQNYQWGPAEILSPTNVFFHFANSQRSFSYKEKGRTLLRANLNPSDNWTIVMIAEPVDNKTEHWVEEQKFYPQTAFKVERQFSNPANSWAFIVGRSGPKAQYIGTHFTWAATDAFSVYMDGKSEVNSFYYQPVEVSPGIYNLEYVSPQSPEWKNLVVGGVRWEGRVDLRQEFIWNELGYSEKQWQQALGSVAFTNPNAIQNLKRFAKNGLELNTQSYSYTSLRIPDLGDRRQIHLGIRLLYGLTTESSALQLNYEHDWNDFTVLSAEAVMYEGDKNTEFTLLHTSQLSLGFKMSF